MFVSTAVRSALAFCLVLSEVPTISGSVVSQPSLAYRKDGSYDLGIISNTPQTCRQLEDHMRGNWLPHRSTLRSWLTNKVEQVDKAGNVTLDPSLVRFQKLVNGDPGLSTLAVDMFNQVPNMAPYNETPTGTPQVRNFNHMLQMINSVLTEGPQFFERQSPSTAMGLIGVPINAIVDWPMGTRAGYTFFLNPEVNQALKDVLNTWGAFLASPASQKTLTQPGGWLSDDAMKVLNMKGNDGKTSLNFSQLYNCDPTQANYGFNSWDAFFTRTFRPGVRPVTPADNATASARFPSPKSVIVNSCESTPFRYEKNVSYYDTFWLKGQPYSLANMLNNGPYTEKFVGGSVYQGYLSSESYHRWHAPIDGTIVRVENVPGTYYSENIYEGFLNNGSADPQAPSMSQPFVSAVATRALIYIQANNQNIGLMAASYIGMAEVSSCEITVKPGDKVHKGDQLGMFHFGGSTHALIFGPQVNLKFLSDPSTWADQMNNNAINDALAVVEAPNSSNSTASGGSPT